MVNQSQNHSQIERFGLVAVVLFLIGQAVAAVIWGTKLETRVNVMEVRGPPTSDGLAQRIIVIEERQRLMIEQLQRNSEKVDNLIDSLRSPIPTPRRP